MSATRRAGAAKPICSGSVRTCRRRGIGHTGTARYAGAARDEVADGVRISRAGGRYSVYIWALLAMFGARLGVGPLRGVRPDVVIDTQNGWPFFARLVFGRRVAVLVHHCHREQWPLAGRWLGRLGWFCESRLSPRMHRRNQYVTVSLPSARDLTDLGVDVDRIAVVRNGLDKAPPRTDPALRRRRGWWCCPGWCRTSTSRTRSTPSRCCGPAFLDLHLDIVGDGWWRTGWVAHGPARHHGLGDVSRPRQRDDETRCAATAWVHVLPSCKEGWGLAVTEAAQHGVPTLGYRASGGLTDSIIDGVTGMLVDTAPSWSTALTSCSPTRCCVTNWAARRRPAAREFSWRQSADAMRVVLESVADRPTRSAAWSAAGADRRRNASHRRLIPWRNLPACRRVAQVSRNSRGAAAPR